MTGISTSSPCLIYFHWIISHLSLTFNIYWVAVNLNCGCPISPIPVLDRRGWRDTLEMSLMLDGEWPMNACRRGIMRSTGYEGKLKGCDLQSHLTPCIDLATDEK